MQNSCYLSEVTKVCLFTLQEKSVAGCLQDARFAGAGGPPGRAHTDLSGGCWSDRAAAGHSDSPPRCKQMAKTPDYLQMHSSTWDWQNTRKSSFSLWLLVDFLCRYHHAISAGNTVIPCSQTHDKSNTSRWFNWFWTTKVPLTQLTQVRHRGKNIGVVVVLGFCCGLILP